MSEVYIMKLNMRYMMSEECMMMSEAKHDSESHDE